MKFRRNDPSIFEACERVREVINKGQVTSAFTPGVLKEILEFMKNILEKEYNSQDELEIYQIVTLIEDETFDAYQYEIDEIERAYELYLESFKEYDIIFQTICQCKLLPSVEDCYKNTFA